MKSEEILLEIQTILKSMGKNNISRERDLTKDGILDSIEIIDFLLSIDKKFNTNIPERDFYSKELSKINNLINFISSTIRQNS